MIFDKNSMSYPMKIRYLVGILMMLPFCTMAANASLEVSESTLNHLVERLGKLSGAGVYQDTSSIRVPGIEICHSTPRRWVSGLFEPGSSPTITDTPGRGSSNKGGTLAYFDCPQEDRVTPGAGGIDRINLVFCETADGGVEILPLGEEVHWQWWVTDASFDIDTGSLKFTATINTRVNGTTGKITENVTGVIAFDGTHSKIKIQLGNLKIPLMFNGEVIHQIDVAKLYSFSIPLASQTITIPMIDGTQKTITGKVVGVSSQYQHDNIHLDVDLDF